MMALGESFNQIASMLPDTAWKIRCDADVKRSITSTGKYVDTRLAREHDFESIRWANLILLQLTQSQKTPLSPMKSGMTNPTSWQQAPL